MISHQEASLDATRLDSGAGSNTGAMAWITWLLDKWRLEDEASKPPSQRQPQPALRRVPRHEDLEEEEAKPKARTNSSAESTPVASSSASDASLLASTPPARHYSKKREPGQESC